MQNPDIRDQFILKLTYHSNSIEGSTLSEPDTAAILFADASVPNKTMTEHLEAKNHQAALLYLFSQIESKQKIDEKFILKLQGILMNGILPDAGLYRQHGVRIVGVDLPTANFLSIPKRMAELILVMQKNLGDTILTATKVHSEFEKIHPFSDGNGRVGRLIMNAMLLQNNLAPAIIHQSQKRLYYTFLYIAQTKNDYSQLEDFICDATMDGFKILTRKDK